MAEFGWAYIADGAITEAQGLTGSILLKKGEKQISGSANLTFNTGSNQLNVIGDISASVNVSASAFYGDGSNLTGIASSPGGSDTQIQFNDGGSFGGSSNLVYDGTNLILSGNLEVSGSVYANELVVNVTNRNVVNISATGSTEFGDTSDDTHTFVGSITGSKMNLAGLTAGTATTSSFLALDSSNNVILTSSAGGSGGGSGEIGAAEDGDYTDGLFTDFTTSTLIGVPIDRFNEVLKILAPSPAPALSRVNYDNSAGSTVKLSFGSSNALSDYTSSNTTAGFTAVDVSQSYSATTSGDNFRLGVYANDTDITGFLNFNVTEVTQNTYVAYSDDAFGNAETGSLKLEVNGNVIHTVDLSAFAGSGNPPNGTANSLTGDSGFTNISVSASSFDGNNSEWYIFKHRTAKFKVDINDMVPGWNYARAIHTLGATDYATNYVEWINDPSGSVDDLSVSNGRIEDISLVGSKYLSGVQYNTDATANYKVDINNLYRNVYQASGTPISFTVTNSTTPSAQSVQDIDTVAGEDHTKILGVTASLDYNSNSLVSGSITANVTVTHPFKATISTTGSATTGDGFLIDNRTLASTNLSEKFHDETYRKASGSYDAQGNVTAGTALWNSQNHMTGGGASGHTDGLLMFNQRLYSPVDGDIPAGGDFSSLANVESGQPDYSGVTGTRTFYRSIQNTSNDDLYNFEIESTKVGTSYNNSSLGTGNVHFFAKIPGTTGWMDISQGFTYGNTSDNDGALISAASDSDTHIVTFGTTPVADDDYIMIKILADESWAGYISQLDFSLPANQSQATPQVLSDINSGQTGTSAKLSFGSSNNVSGYTSVEGDSTGSLSDIDTNGLYSVSGDRRGIFSSYTEINGNLNDAIAGGAGYPVDAVYNGYSGSIVLEVNGSDVHTIDLSSTLNSIPNDFNGNGSGFNLSAVSFSTLSNIPDYTKPYRTGTYKIAAGDQNPGWNYARVKHGSNTTNYVEWVVDPSGSVNNTNVSTGNLSNFGHTSVYYQSGIGYFATNPTGSFTYTGSNFYSNVYSNETDAISFSTTRCNTTNIRVTGSGVVTFNGNPGGDEAIEMPALNNSSSCQTTRLQITGTLQYNGSTPSISGGLGLFTKYNVSVDSTIKHPFKSNRTTSTLSKNAFMIYSGSIGSTNLNTNEYFNTETYRIVSGNYATQAEVTSSSNAWNSQRSMNDGSTYPEYNDGMVTVNGFLISPMTIGNDGDTRNVSDGGSLQAPSGNPNYSSSELSESVRTYYRYFRNTGVTTVQNFNLYVEGDASIVAKQGAVHYGALGANNRINIEMKVPGQTAWGDIAIPQGGVDPTSDGDGIFNGGNGNLDQDASDGSNVAITLGTLFWSSNDYIVLKISAHKDWTGYLTEITASY